MLAQQVPAQVQESGAQEARGSDLEAAEVHRTQEAGQTREEVWAVNRQESHLVEMAALQPVNRQEGTEVRSQEEVKVPIQEGGKAQEFRGAVV